MHLNICICVCLCVITIRIDCVSPPPGVCLGQTRGLYSLPQPVSASSSSVLLCDTVVCSALQSGGIWYSAPGPD